MNSYHVIYFVPCHRRSPTLQLERLVNSSATAGSGLELSQLELMSALQQQLEQRQVALDMAVREAWTGAVSWVQADEQDK